MDVTLTTRLNSIALAGLLCFCATSSMAAQAGDATRTIPEGTLAPGMTVWITDSSGREEKMRIVSVATDRLTAAAGADVLHIDAADVTRVRVRQSDSLLNGALIGAGAAVGSALLFCRAMEPWENCRDDYGPMLRIGAIGAGIGLGIDALIRGRRSIYEAAEGSPRLQAAPLLGRRGAGLRISVTF